MREGRFRLLYAAILGDGGIQGRVAWAGEEELLSMA